VIATDSSKAKNRCTIYREGPAFFRRRKWKITFERRTAFVLALKHPNGTKSAFPKFSTSFSAQSELNDFLAFFRLAVPDENGHDLFFFFAGI